MPGTLRIGQLAKAVGVSASTLRYYDELGLLQAPRRSESGYRLYGSGDLKRLEFIRKAKGFGFSLGEIRDTLGVHARQEPVCVHVLALIDQKLGHVDRLIRQMREFRSDLARLRREAAQRAGELEQDAAICGIVEQGMHHRGELALAWLESREKP